MIGVVLIVFVYYICRVIISIGNSSSNSYVFCGILVISSKIVFLWLFIDIWVFLI